MMGVPGIIKRLMRRVPGTRRLFAISVLLGVFAGAAMMLEAAWLADIADSAFMGGWDVLSLLPLFIALLVWILLRGILQAAGEYAAAQATQRIKSSLRRRLLKKLAELGPNYVKGERTGELISTAFEGVEQLEIFLARYLPQLALSTMIPAAVFIVVARLDTLSAVVLAVTLPLLVLFMILIGKAAKAKADRQFKTLGLLGAHFLDVLRGLPTLKIFNRSAAQIGIISRIGEEYRKTTMGTLRLAFLSAFVMELFATLSTAIVAVFLGLRLVEGRIGFEQAFLVLLLTPEFYLPVRAVGSQFHASTNGVSAAERIMVIFDEAPPGWVERAGARRLPVNNRGYRIEFRDVEVRYPDMEEAALSDITLTLEPGERIAVIGPTGSGKSTLLDLLQGFVRPSAGKILINGVDMSELSMDWWHSQLSAVSQQVRLFHGTVRENVRMGNPEASKADISEALRAACADFIEELPDGYDTVLGESVRLSGGQTQRIAIARAVLRKSPLLLLDEPTTGLDVIHEASVREGLERLLAGCMSVTVAHRLETVRRADRIIVLSEGRIAESGPPDQLLAAGGLYAKMAHAWDGGNTWDDGHRDAGFAIPELEDVSQEAAEGPAVRRPVSQVLCREKQADDGQQLVAMDQLEGKGCNGKRTSLETFLRLLQFIRPYKLQAALAVLLSFATVAANIGLMGTSGYLIARAALQPETVLMLMTLIVGVRFFGIARGVFRYLERLASHDLTFRLLQQIRVWLYSRLEPRGAVLFEKERSGNVLAAMISDVDQLQNLYLRVLAPPIVALLTVILAFSIMAAHDPYLAFVLSGMFILAGTAVPWAAERFGRAIGVKAVQARSNLYVATADLLYGLKEIAVFGQTGERLIRINSIQEQTDMYQRKINRLNALTSGVMLIAAHAAMWSVLLTAVNLADLGRIERVAIPALAVVALACFEAVIPLSVAFQQLGPTLSSAGRLFRLADGSGSLEKDGQFKEDPLDPNLPPPPPDTKPAAAAPVPAAGWQLQINKLSFRYDAVSPYVIRGLSLTLRQGRRIAIVGESGSGKSTLLQVLLRLRPYSEGSIVLNGTELRELPEEEVRSAFAVVSQNVQLFHATAAANLRLGNREATDEDLRAAARQALIDNTLSKLPNGYETVIGEWGAKLSGGERQRLALARALLRNAPAVLFDEPAAGLDPLTERAFLSNMETTLRDHAVLWITHSLAWMERMDEIIVLQGGEVKERGTHEELLHLRGYYWRMRQLERERDWQQLVKNV